MSIYRSGGKRAADLLVAATLLIATAPVTFAAAVAVAARMGRPVLFRQKRLGYNGQVFTVLKFRTMREATDAMGVPLPDVKRLTPLGRVLRRTSVDELPQLLNVVVGDMSLVGPRPLYLKYGPYYRERERLRHTVRPGITGLAQIKGRNTLSWDERLEWDVRYVERHSLMLDLKIVGQTIAKVLRREGIGEQLLPDLSDERRAEACREPSSP